MNITIKKMETEEEIKGKAFVHWSSWHDSYPGLVNQQYLDNLTLQKCETIAFEWPDNIIIAKDQNCVIGFIGYGDQGKELPDYGEIFSLYVLHEYRGKGVGRRLMEAAFEKLDERKRICLWVLKENKRAINFYQKIGFRPDGTEKLSASVAAVGIRMILIR